MKKESDKRKKRTLLKWQKIINLLLLILLALPVLGWGLASPAYGAAALKVSLTKDGKTVTAADYTHEQLSALGLATHNYSSVDATGAPVGIVARGVTVSKLLSALGISQTDVESLRLSSSDGWSRSYNLSGYMSSNRRYFPRIVECRDLTAAEQPAFLPGAEDNAVTVPALLAVLYYEERDNAAPDASLLNDKNGLRFCYGQSTISEEVSLNFGKHITSLNIIVKSGSSFVLPATSEEPGEPADPAAPAVPSTGLAEVLDREGLMAGDLTVTVGYWGGEHYTKAVFTAEELAAMADVKQIYSIIDNMPSVCLDAAIGVRLTDILAVAGIDVNSVQSFNFYCADVARTWYTTYTKSYLLDTPRYYYPKLPVCWDREEARALPGATAGAVPVDAILAVRDKWRRMATEIDFNNMTDTTRYRLVFGQTDVSTVEGSRSAKWVHTLAVTLGGSPPKGVYLDADSLKLKVGSSHQLSAQVDKTDNTTDTRVSWSSSDESVVTVDDHGRLTVVGEGEAVITVTTLSGGLTDSVAVNSVNDGEEPAPAASSKKEQPVVSKGQVYKLRLGGQAAKASEDAAVQNWRDDAMASDAIALGASRSSGQQAQGAISVLFIAGIAGRLIIFRLEV
ncbi:MAG TPA: Ig domain-containing protein [Clostridiales bacterium]|nr:Ig domain-containing protein [Clostridiales bacterium]